MEPKKLGVMMQLDVRYLEKRTVHGKPGFVWYNRHAKRFGMKATWLGFDPVTAAQRADELNRRYDAARKGQNTFARGSLGWMLREIENSDEHKDRPDKVRNEVENAFKRLRDTPLITEQMKDITGKHCKVLAKKLAPALGVSKTHRTMKWMRYAFSQAKEAGEIAMNPLEGVRIKKPSARQVVLWDDEVEDLIAYFRLQDRFSLALATRFAFDTSQRSDDLITLSWTRWNNGDMRVKQAKTGATVLVPALPELRAMVAEIDRDKVSSTQIIINEATGRPYTDSNFSHLVNDACRTLGFKDPDTGQNKVFRDLRRSAVVRLALAGCTIPMISAITGHSYAHCEQILETYLPRTTEMARLAIQRLLDSRQKA